MENLRKKKTKVKEIAYDGERNIAKLGRAGESNV
jgi:hypothetical protein